MTGMKGDPTQSTQADKAAPDSAIERFKAEAFPHLPALLRTARLMARHEQQAEDLVQETMLRALKHVNTYQPGTNMKAWLMTIMRRAHIDLHRMDARRIAPASLDAMPVEPADRSTGSDADEAWAEPEDLLERFDDEDIEAALRELPEPMRWVLLLVDVNQSSVAEAAEVLGVAEGTIKSRASRAREKLRTLLLPVAQERGWLPAEAKE